MQKNILEYLEQTVTKVPDKTAYSDGDSSLSFKAVFDQAQAIGTFLSSNGYYREPIVIFMKRSPETIVSFFGTIYAGCFYIPVDEEMPEHRIQLIFENLEPRAVICDDSTVETIRKFNYTGVIYQYNEMINTAVEKERLDDIRAKQIDTDPIYVVFTSGSTGIPKGVTACHRSVIDYIESLSGILKTSEQTVFGNQTPLYFDACLKEVICTIRDGGTTYLIPKTLFMFPIRLVEYMNTYRINTVCWVSSALTMISGFGVLKKMKPEYLHTIAFGSEVFAIRQFNLWREALPEARFINLYGPTECTGMSCYYEVDREFSLDDVIPIGKAFPNREILLLNEQNELAAADETGEICVRGTALTLGYYNNSEKTKEVFVQNPLNPHYPELIYRTGDLGRYNEYGELVFVSRKDYQIKHMGHRIELGEIELGVNTLEGIQNCCCIYDEVKGKIILFYAGEVSSKEVLNTLKEKLPRYMIPNTVRQLEQMPYMENGKINRVFLKNTYMKKKRET